MLFLVSMLIVFVLLAAGLATGNVSIVPGFTTNSVSLSGGVTVDNLPAAEFTSHVGVTSSVSMPPTVTHLQPTSSTSSVLSLPSVTSVAPLPFTSAGVANTTSETTTSWQRPQPSFIAGVDLNQLPPLQRQLFLRIHQQQQKDTTVSTAPSASHSLAPLQTMTPAVIPPPGIVSIFCILP